jgi:hypothetical protein
VSKPTIAVLAVVLAAGGFTLGYWTASRPPQRVARSSAPTAVDPARRAIEERVRAPGSLENLEQLAHLLTKLGPDAIPAIAPTILHPGETLDGPRALILLQFWIDHDAKGAAEWIAKRAPLGYRSLGLIPAIEKLAESDPQSALRLVGRARGADPQLIKPLVRGWVRSGQPGVADWIRNLDYGFKRQKALGAFWRAKIEKDGAPAAIAWLEALPDREDGFYEEAFLRLTGELTYADPASGVAWYEKHRDGPRSRGLMMAVVDAWVAVDGPAAMRWVSQQPEGAERDNAVLDGVRWWGIANVDALKRWGREQGVDQLAAAWFQPGLPIFAQLYANDEAVEGIHWAERIADAAIRDLTLVQIARDWHQKDPSAAEAWLAQSPLSEDNRARARTVPTPARAPEPAAPNAKAPAD